MNSLPNPNSSAANMLALPNPNRSDVGKAIGFAVLETTSRDATMQAGSGSGGAMCAIGVTRRPIAEREGTSAIVSARACDEAFRHCSAD